jgi:hypothetical protein
MENIARKTQYPCANREKGCHSLFSREQIVEHSDFCPYEKINCPFQIINNCPWEGFNKDLPEHAYAAHSYNVIELSTSPPSVDANGVLRFLYNFENSFLLYYQVRDGILYGAMKLFGKTSEARRYMCDFKILAENGEEINGSFKVRPIKEDWDQIFNSGNCFSVDLVKYRQFRARNLLNLTTTVHELPTISDTFNMVLRVVQCVTCFLVN